MKKIIFLITLNFFAFSATTHAQKGQFESSEEFRVSVFHKTEMPWQTLWLNKELRDEISLLLNRSYSGLRIRYWGEGSTTAWIFEEIGKELPITVGVAVNEKGIKALSVLEYRETRGGEVRHEFFTRQFLFADLENTDMGYKFNKDIDGITGATLSVRALKKVAALALFCHKQTPFAVSELAAKHTDGSVDGSQP